MKPSCRLLFLFLTAALILGLTGCGSIEFDIENTIKPPLYDDLAVQGTWKIDGYISIVKERKNSQNTVEEIRKNYVGKAAMFDNELGAVGSDVCVNPVYRVIRTTADTFIQSKYRVDEDELGLQKDKVAVVTVTADSQPFYELIITEQMKAYAYLDNGFLVLSKASDKIDEELKEKSFGNVGMNINNGVYTEDPLLRSGVLIGIRSADNTYRTLWVYSKNREIKNVKTGEQLVVPRARGFWEVGESSDNSTGSIYAKPFAEGVQLAGIQEQSRKNSMTESQDTRIHFVGNDYIGIENNSKFKVIPIDNISGGRGVRFSDISVENDPNAFEQSTKDFISTLPDSKGKNAVNGADEENFTLMRRNGHWILRSRIYYKEPVGNNKFEDFDLKLMVPPTLIHYDEMDIQWSEIKSILPWTTDAYMSPNKDISLLVSENSIGVYAVQKLNIINKQLAKITLAKGDSIVMAEWSIGKYADIWDNFVNQVFIRSGPSAETDGN